MIDERAIIDPSAKIAENVTIGPYAVIGPNVEIGEGTWIAPHGFVVGYTKIGKNNKIHQFASIGEIPQDKKYQGEETYLEIGDGNVFREFCTINRGTAQDVVVTRIGDDNLFMNYVHVAHDCQIGSHTIFSNNASLAGHVVVDDYVILGAFSAVYQFCHLGQHSFIASGSMVVKDVLPFIRVTGVFAKPCGLNLVGLRRRGFDQDTRTMINRAYKAILREGLTTQEAIEQLTTDMLPKCAEIQLFIDMLQNTTHGISR